MPFSADAKPFTLRGASPRALIVSCYDGDSFKAVFPIPGIEGGKDYLWSCRMLGLDTPEMRSKSLKEKAWARVARDRARELMVGKVVVMDVGEFDKYGRVLARPWLLDEDGLARKTDVSKLLVEENLGRPYEGVGTKADWDALTPPDGVTWEA